MVAYFYQLFFQSCYPYFVIPTLFAYTLIVKKIMFLQIVYISLFRIEKKYLYIILSFSISNKNILFFLLHIKN